MMASISKKWWIFSPFNAKSLIDEQQSKDNMVMHTDILATEYLIAGNICGTKNKK